MYGVKRSDVQVTPVPELDLKGKTVLVVGGTSGIGRAIALAAAAKGAKVTVVGRSFKDAGVEGVTHVPADLTLMVNAKRLGRELPAADVVALTTGIVAAPKREETAEGLEQDMAVSTLSRLVLLRELMPRLSGGARVFVWGMPGNGMEFKFDDLNAEKGYAGGFGFVHANTVGGNESLVHVLAEQHRARNVSVYGMNPGLMVSGIRSPLYGGGGGLVSRIAEGMLGFFTPSVDKYATWTVPLMFAPGLEAHSGAMFGQDGGAIKPNKEFETPGRAQQWYDALAALVKAKAGI